MNAESWLQRTKRISCDAMTPLFSSAFEAVLFWVILLGGLVETSWAARRAGGMKRPDKKREGTERFRAAVPLLFISTFVIPVAVGYARIGPLPHSLFYPGLVMYAVGTVIANWMVLTLGHYHSMFIRVVSDHKLIEEGPYRLLRHPQYASQIFSFIGLGLALQSWLALLIILVPYTVFYANRIRVEERFLAEELGSDYTEYMKRTKRLIPFIW
jgi:protein-S-isoprenylcysteine O-methyltransferase Ste14